MGTQLDLEHRVVVIDSGYAPGKLNGIPTRVMARFGDGRVLLGPEVRWYVAHDFQVADVDSERGKKAIADRARFVAAKNSGRER